MGHIGVLYADTKTFDGLCKEDVLRIPYVQERVNTAVKELQEKKKKKGAPVTEEEQKSIQIKATRDLFAIITRTLIRNLCGKRYWDYCQLGIGPLDAFIVKEDCPYVAGVSSDSAPEGYIRADAARKRDIQWDVMRKWAAEMPLEDAPEPQSQKYFCTYIDAYVDTKGELKWLETDASSAEFDAYIDSLPDDVMLLILDCHE